MYDPLRHNFFAGFDVADEIVSRLQSGRANCIICLNSQADHDPN